MHKFHEGCILLWLNQVKLLLLLLKYRVLNLFCIAVKADIGICTTQDSVQDLVNPKTDAILYFFLCLFYQTNSCPVCRYELPTDNPEYEELRSERVSYNWMK